MDRRDFLRRGALAVGAVASLSGCTSHRLQESERKPPVVDGIGAADVDLPVRQPLGVAEEGIERGARADIADVDEFGAYLDESDVTVEHLEETTEAGEHLLSLEYVLDDRSDRGLMHHLGLVAGGYAALVADGHDGEKLEAHLLDSSSREFGAYEIRRHWAVEYNDDVLTAREYADEIAVTVETA